MAATTSSYSITMRLYTAPDHGVIGAVATRISEAGGIVTAIDMAESRHDRLVVDVTCSAANEEHSLQLVACVEEIAFRMGYITPADLLKLARTMGSSTYGQYLFRVVDSES